MLLSMMGSLVVSDGCYSLMGGVLVWFLSVLMFGVVSLIFIGVCGFDVMVFVMWIIVFLGGVLLCLRLFGLSMICVSFVWFWMIRNVMVDSVCLWCI